MIFSNRPFMLRFHASLLLTGLTLFGIFFSGTVHSQVSQPHRYERKQKSSDDYFNVISLKEEGLALYRERDKYRNNNKIWELVLLDTALNEKKSIELEVKDRYKLIGYEVVPGNVYFLYRTGETTKNDFLMIQVSVAGEELRRFDIKPDLDFRLTHFCKVSENFVFGGYVNSDPAVFIYDTTTKLIKVVPGFFQKDTELVDLRANVNNTFNTVMIDRGSRGDRKLTFRTFTAAGEILLEDIVAIDENKTLQTGITSTLEREDLVLLGNWGEKSSKQSKGFFSLTVDPFNDQKIKYVDFGQLNHYLDYLNPKRAQKLKDESRADAEAGRIPGYTNYVMPYRVVENKDGYLLLAEVYTPNTTASPYYSSPYYNPYYYSPPMGYGSFYRSRMYQPYPYNGDLKDSDIKTNETVLLSIDGSGNFRWDFSMKLEQTELPSVEQATDFSVVNGKVYFMYRHESELKIKMIHMDDGTSEDLSQKIKPLEDGDEIRSDRETEGGVRHWYDGTFYVWGYETVKNNAKEDRTRDVFYLNKVTTR
jgi:hypothetical protein